MASLFFKDTFGNVPMPVIVCESGGANTIVYVNTSALILINPGFRENAAPLSALLPIEQMDSFCQLLLGSGSVEGWKAKVPGAGNREIAISLVANYVELNKRGYFVIYVYQEHHGESLTPYECNNILSLAFLAANQARDAEHAIEKVLALLGESLKVSRAYVLEFLNPQSLRNTYEWCGEGISSVLDQMQQFPAQNLHMETLTASGIYLTEDISVLPEEQRLVLEQQQIKSLAVLPLYQASSIQGYVGFDDCCRQRRWSGAEIQLLRNVSKLISAILHRRQAESRSRQGFYTLQAILDNIDHAIYVNTTDSHRLVFMNQTMADALGCTAEEALGRPCWKAIYGADAPCSFCPMGRISDKEAYQWERQQNNGRWYAMKDVIIQWMDGQTVHIGTSLDITDRHHYEARLKHIASIDTMTGTYNREWGYKLMRDMLADAAIFPHPVSLVFIDLDGLKHTNDTFGHDAGDDMIISIIEAIRQNVRQSDAICRWGGDEFILILRCQTDIAQTLMEKISLELNRVNQTGEKPYMLSFSYGIVSLTDEPSATIDTVIAQADQLMYAQKMKKRGQAG